MWHFKLCSHTTYNYTWISYTHISCGIEIQSKNDHFTVCMNFPFSVYLIWASVNDESLDEFQFYIFLCFRSIYKYILLQFLLFSINFSLYWVPAAHIFYGIFHFCWSQNAIHPHRNLLFIFFALLFLMTFNFDSRKKKIYRKTNMLFKIEYRMKYVLCYRD